jgi:hypothetical protein
MILSVHAVFGAAVASLMPNHPVAGFALGFASHFALDSIPHKDYELISVDFSSNTKDKVIDIIQKKFSLIRDIILVSFDAFLGFILAFMFFFNPVHPLIFFLGAFAALIPDGLTFLYFTLKHKPLGHFFDFHAGLIHSKVIFKLNQLAGVFLQFCTLAVLIAILYGVKYFLIYNQITI